MCHNQQWGTICKDNLSDKNIQVVCNQLGYNAGGYSYKLSSDFYLGTTSNPIVYIQIDCKGDETNIVSCEHKWM